MHIRPYQIHNILRTYSNKIIRQNSQTVSHLTVPAEGKRRAVIEQVANDIINKITQLGLEHKGLHENEAEREYSFRKRDEFKKNKFIYNVIDENNHKAIRTFSSGND